MDKLFGGIYKRKRVFLTGHSGFKGSWMAFWLKELGAIVKGYSLPPNTSPSHWDLLNLDIESVYGDIRDKKRLFSEVNSFKPDIVIHMAAQPLVRLSYENPYETYETNVLGTMALFEACRKTNSIKAIVNITTDKCYENKEWIWGYRENEPMGGYDPYSSSKGCIELMTSSYRRSFYNIDDFGKHHNTLLASVRAGNVIGGGDWANDRLVPDIMKAASKNETVHIRNRYATRPWQHVLEPLTGYLLLGKKLLEGEVFFADGWNFGPDEQKNLTVGDVVNCLKDSWQNIDISYGVDKEGPHEAGLLKLDCTKAHTYLKWFNVWDNHETFSYTTEWYKKFYTEGIINTAPDLQDFIEAAVKSNQIWTR